MEKKKEEYLNNIYYNPVSPASFSGEQKLHSFVKEEGKMQISLKEIKKWIQSQEVHTTNRLARRKVNRRKVIVPYIDYMWDIDTASFLDYKKENKNFGYFILAIDVFSRFIWTEAVKTASAQQTKLALQRIFQKGRTPSKMRSDKGNEFSNKLVQAYLKTKGIEHFVTQNEVKANYAERGIQTMKGKISRYLRANQTHEWVDQLQKLTTSYNNSFHRSIKRKPSSVTKKDESKLWKELYNLKKPILKKIKYKFNKGDIVRISKLRKTFQRYYSEHWTNELFIIKERSMKQYIPTYYITDYYGEEIEGLFYEEELQKVYVNEDTLYNIEKVLKERKINRKSESLVKWMGWPEKFNTWLPTKDLKDYK